MIRGNLATSPFYNERAAHALLAAFAILVVLLTLFNIYRVVTLSSRNTVLSVDIRRDEETATRMRQEAARLRGRINEQELEQVMAGAREANALIDRRTFSWTEFFNLIERTLPENVMLTSVTPTVEHGRTIVEMGVMGRRAEDIDAFMEQLEGTKAFRGVLPRDEDITDEGLHRMTLIAEYAAPHIQPAEGAQGTRGNEGTRSGPGSTPGERHTATAYHQGPEGSKTPKILLSALGAFVDSPQKALLDLRAFEAFATRRDSERSGQRVQRTAGAPAQGAAQ
jgi:hypothetical protein